MTPVTILDERNEKVNCEVFGNIILRTESTECLNFTDFDINHLYLTTLSSNQYKLAVHNWDFTNSIQLDEKYYGDLGIAVSVILPCLEDEAVIAANYMLNSLSIDMSQLNINVINGNVNDIDIEWLAVYDE